MPRRKNRYRNGNRKGEEKTVPGYTNTQKAALAYYSKNHLGEEPPFRRLKSKDLLSHANGIATECDVKIQDAPTILVQALFIGNTPSEHGSNLSPETKKIIIGSLGSYFSTTFTTNVKKELCFDNLLDQDTIRDIFRNNNCVVSDECMKNLMDRYNAGYPFCADFFNDLNENIDPKVKSALIREQRKINPKNRGDEKSNNDSYSPTFYFGDLGIADHQKSGGNLPVMRQLVVFRHHEAFSRASVLVSTSAPIVDFWSTPLPFETPGGNHQIYHPSSRDGSLAPILLLSLHQPATAKYHLLKYQNSLKEQAVALMRGHGISCSEEDSVTELQSKIKDKKLRHLVHPVLKEYLSICKLSESVVDGNKTLSRPVAPPTPSNKFLTIGFRYEKLLESIESTREKGGTYQPFLITVRDILLQIENLKKSETKLNPDAIRKLYEYEICLSIIKKDWIKAESLVEKALADFKPNDDAKFLYIKMLKSLCILLPINKKINQERYVEAYRELTQVIAEIKQNIYYASIIPKRLMKVFGSEGLYIKDVRGKFDAPPKHNSDNKPEPSCQFFTPKVSKVEKVDPKIVLRFAYDYLFASYQFKTKTRKDLIIETGFCNLFALDCVTNDVFDSVMRCITMEPITHIILRKMVPFTKLSSPPTEIESLAYNLAETRMRALFKALSNLPQDHALLDLIGTEFPGTYTNPETNETFRVIDALCQYIQSAKNLKTLHLEIYRLKPDEVAKIAAEILKNPSIVEVGIGMLKQNDNTHQSDVVTPLIDLYNAPQIKTIGVLLRDKIQPENLRLLISLAKTRGLTIGKKTIGGGSPDHSAEPLQVKILDDESVLYHGNPYQKLIETISEQMAISAENTDLGVGAAFKC